MNRRPRQPVRGSRPDWRASLLAASLAALPATAKADELPALERWRFQHPIDTLHVASTQDLTHLFTARNYSLPTMREGEPVPRLYLCRLVGDLSAVEPVAHREALFIRIVLPLVQRANAEITAQRKFLEEIIAARSHGTDTPPGRREWLDALARLYGGDPQDPARLLERVDEIPASLAIAQAIDESGWGTSDLAHETNGMFGEHAPAGQGRGSIRVASANVNVAAFPSLLDGVLAYMTNINRNHAYEKLRALRAQRRREGLQPDGNTLAGELADYSERGMAYVHTLRRLIHEHRLDHYDAARLTADGGTTLIHAPR